MSVAFGQAVAAIVAIPVSFPVPVVGPALSGSAVIAALLSAREAIDSYREFRNDLDMKTAADNAALHAFRNLVTTSSSYYSALSVKIDQ